MQPELAFKAVSHTVIGLSFVTFFLLVLVSLRKELRGDNPIRGIVHFGVGLIALCAFVALVTAYFHLNELTQPHRNSKWLDVVSLQQTKAQFP